MNFLLHHPALDTIASYWIFSAIVGGMPPPTTTSSPVYVWVHNSLHLLAGNLSSAFAAKFPNLPQGGTVVETQTKETTVNPPASKP